jgi:general secretion pathway protein C
MSARWWAFGLWAAVAASALYWGLRLFAPGEPAPAHAVVAVTPPPRGDLTRLLGVDAPPAVETAAPVAEASRFQLVGVVAPRAGAGAGGVALIAVDGKPARAYRVGTAVDGDTVVQSVRQRGAALGPRGGASTVSLEIPPPAPAATGTLPAPGAAAPALPVARPAVPMPQPITLPQGAAPARPYVAPPPMPAPPPVMPRPQPDAALPRHDGVPQQ